MIRTRRCRRGHLSQLVNESQNQTGSDRALEILDELNGSAYHRTITVRGGRLGDDGLDALLVGLVHRNNALVLKNEASVNQLSALTLANCGVTDAGMMALMCHLAGKIDLDNIHIYGKEITFKTGTGALVKSINSARLVTLDLSQNQHLHSLSMTRFLMLLDSPYLHSASLVLGDSGLGSEHTDAIAAYLSSPRSRALRILTLNDNHFQPADFETIIDAIEKHNFTLTSVSIIGPWGRHASHPEAAKYNMDLARSDVIREMDGNRLHYLTVKRNGDLEKRVRKASLRCLPYARILLNAQSASAEDSTPSIKFPLMELPPEILHHAHLS